MTHTLIVVGQVLLLLLVAASPALVFIAWDWHVTGKKWAAIEREMMAQMEADRVEDARRRAEWLKTRPTRKKP